MELTTQDWHVGFDLDVSVIDEAESDARLWNSTLSGTLKRLGEILDRQKALLPHGSFESWVTNRLGITPEVARETRRAAGVLRRADSPALEQACSDRKALVMLDGVTDEILDAAVDLAEEQGKLKRTDVRRLKGLLPATPVVPKELLEAEVAKALAERERKQQLDLVLSLQHELGTVCALLDYEGDKDQLYPQLTNVMLKWHPEQAGPWQTLRERQDEAWQKLQQVTAEIKRWHPELAVELKLTGTWEEILNATGDAMLRLETPCPYTRPRRFVADGVRMLIDGVDEFIDFLWCICAWESAHPVDDTKFPWRLPVDFDKHTMPTEVQVLLDGRTLELQEG